MSFNIRKDQMWNAELFGKHVLFTDWQIKRDEVPKGWFCYDLRGADHNRYKAVTLEDKVAQLAVNLHDELTQHFDCAAFVKAEIDKKELVPCATGYIARNARKPQSDYYLLRAQGPQEDAHANSATQTLNP